MVNGESVPPDRLTRTPGDFSRHSVSFEAEASGRMCHGCSRDHEVVYAHPYVCLVGVSNITRCPKLESSSSSNYVYKYYVFAPPMPGVATYVYIAQE